MTRIDGVEQGTLQKAIEWQTKNWRLSKVERGRSKHPILHHNRDINQFTASITKKNMEYGLDSPGIGRITKKGTTSPLRDPSHDQEQAKATLEPPKFDVRSSIWKAGPGVPR
jgi:hypothetical protein